MATALKHKSRSSRKERFKYIPFTMFFNKAYAKEQARTMVKKGRIDLKDSYVTVE